MELSQNPMWGVKMRQSAVYCQKLLFINVCWKLVSKYAQCLWLKATGTSVLTQLASLLKEFYTATDNVRKKEIGTDSVVS